MVTKITMYKLESGPADASGNASAISSKISRGKVLAIHIIYDSGSPATTNVQLTHLGSDYGGADQTILSLSSNNTNGWFYPRTYAQDETGADLTYNGTQKVPIEFVVFGRLKLEVSGQTAGLGVKAYVLVEEY